MRAAPRATRIELMHRLASLLCAAALLLPATALHAQAGYPNRPIRLIVPYPPGEE